MKPRKAVPLCHSATLLPLFCHCSCIFWIPDKMELQCLTCILNAVISSNWVITLILEMLRLHPEVTLDNLSGVHIPQTWGNVLHEVNYLGGRGGSHLPPVCLPASHHWHHPNVFWRLMEHKNMGMVQTLHQRMQWRSSCWGWGVILRWTFTKLAAYPGP